MTSDEFVTWLKGYLEALQSDKAEIKVIFERVAFVTEKPKNLVNHMLTDTPVAHVPPYPLKQYHL
jgi:hypothetical protein